MPDQNIGRVIGTKPAQPLDFWIAVDPAGFVLTSYRIVARGNDALNPGRVCLLARGAQHHGLTQQIRL